MADDGFTIRIDADLAGDVKAAAAARGVSVEAFVHDALASQLVDWVEWSRDPDPAIDVEIAERTLRTGTGIPLEQILERLSTFGQKGE